MQRFIREYLTLLLGALLPVFLVIFFVIANYIPRLITPSPHYNFIYTANLYLHKGAKFEVNNGKLSAVVNAEVKSGMLPMPRLYRYNVKTKTSEEIMIPLNTTKKAENILIPTLKDFDIKKEDISPDGYIVEYTDISPDSLFSFLLYNNKKNLELKKYGNIIPVIDESKDTQGYNTYQFLGWVIEP